jgi:hypothetical protein
MVSGAGVDIETHLMTRVGSIRFTSSTLFFAEATIGIVSGPFKAGSFTQITGGCNGWIACPAFSRDLLVRTTFGVRFRTERRWGI